MNLFNKKTSNRGFTIIELLVTISVLAILVLLGAPRLLSYTQKAELTRIQHDTKVMENKMGKILNQHNHNYDNWENNDKDLGSIILRRKLFEKEGVAKNVYLSHLSLDNKKIVELNDNLGVGGNLHLLNEEGSIDTGYKIIPNKYKDEIGTRLDGTFYSNSLGKVYYEHDKPLSSVKKEQTLACVAAETLDYEFGYLTRTIVKYNGTELNLVIPSAFEVDGKCSPVKTIGRGAFENGNYKTIIIPESVEKIEENAFKGNELKEIEISHGVEEIESGAFANNEVEKAIIKNEDVSISEDAFDGGVIPEFSPVTDKDLGVIFNTSTGAIMSGGGGDSGGNFGSTMRIPKTIYVNGEEYEVKGVAQGAFQGYGLISVILPEGLERIDDYAFEGNQIIGVNIPNSVRHIGNYAFAFNEINKEPTMRSVGIKQEEQVEKINKVGDIEEYGSKVDMIKSSVKLLNQIFVTSSSNFRIPEDYHPGIQVKTELVGLEPVVNGGDPSKGQTITSNVDVTWNGDLSNKAIEITASSNSYEYKIPNGYGGSTTRTLYSSLNLRFLNENNEVLTMIDGKTSVSIGAGNSSPVTSTVTVPEGAVAMRFSSSKSAILREISITEGVILPQSVSNVVSETDDTNIALSWDYDSHHEKVAVYRENEFLTFVTGQSFVDKLINPGTKYTYQLKALDKDGNASPGYIEHTASTTIPELQFYGINSNVIDGDHATGQSLTNLYVTWNKDLSNKGITIVASSNSYKYKVSNGYGGSTTYTGYSSLNLQFLNEKNEVLTMADGKTVASIGTGNSSPVTSTVTVPEGAVTIRFYSSNSATLREIIGPTSEVHPQNVSNITAQTDDTNITLNWDNDGSYDKVSIYRENKILTIVNGQTYTDKLIAPGTEYTYQFRTIDKYGNASPGYVEHTASTTIPKIQFSGLDLEAIDNNLSTKQNIVDKQVIWEGDLSNKEIKIVASSNSYKYKVSNGYGGSTTYTGYSSLNLQFLNENNEVITMTDGKRTITLSTGNSSQVTTTVTVPEGAVTMRFYSSRSGNLHELTILNI